MPSVLIVDDEANIRELVGLYLEGAGYAVGHSADGEEAVALATSGDYDLVVLDVMLPSLSGTEACRQIRERSDIPIIMLTARNSDVEIVSALESGADDYVTKPFSPPELVARVRAVLRRTTEGHPQGSITLGGLSLDPATREVTVDGTQVHLTAKEFDLLHVLMREPGVVMTRQQLLEAAWGFAEYVDERGVDVHIRHIREKLGDDASVPRFIETLRGVGYRAIKDA